MEVEEHRSLEEVVEEASFLQSALEEVPTPCTSESCMWCSCPIDPQASCNSRAHCSHGGRGSLPTLLDQPMQVELEASMAPPQRVQEVQSQCTPQMKVEEEPLKDQEHPRDLLQAETKRMDMQPIQTLVEA